MPVIDTKYYTYRVKLGKDEVAEPELTFRNRVAAEMLAEEPEDVQRRVEQYREFSRKRASGGVLGSVLENETSPYEDEEEEMLEKLVK